MTKVRRGGYVFISWKGDHPPRHVHVYCEGKLILKWDLERRAPIMGRVPGKLLNVIRQLEAEGKL